MTRWTREQASAIEANNRELLISAAAGSGKTAVLIERIMRLIGEGQYSVDKMLIVTYTRAAAAELRERLETRMNEWAQKDSRFVKQAEMLASAQISTIHSYCQKTIREHFKDCEIDPQFILGDERTLQALYQDSLEETLDEAYALAKTDPALEALTAKLSDKELASILDSLYHSLVSRPDPLLWLKAQCDKTWSAATIDQEPAALAFVEEADLAISGALSLWNETVALSKQPAFPQALNLTLQSDLATLNMASEASRQGLTELMRALDQCRFVTIARVKPATDDEAKLVERYKELRQAYKDELQSLRKLLPTSMEAALEDMNRMIPAMKGLYQAAEILFDRYGQKKREAASLDFNDLEHLTLRLLKDDDIRRQESGRFDAVFVDEYQDVSAIQEAILNGLKRETGEGLKQFYFYVGDVKQSIYRFRLAEPKLFLTKLETFSEEEDAERRKIILNQNFRSRVGVLDAVNRTFSHVMDKRVTEIDYDRSAMLYPGVPSVNDPQTELHVCQVEKAKDAPLAEAQLIAEDILRTVGQPVVDGEGDSNGVLHYRDIAILLPVVKNVADKVEQALTKAGIPVYTDAAANALGGEECLQVVQHVLLMENERNDTALIAELRSPLFEMTEPELAAIRLSKPEKEASFLEALRWRAGQPDALGERCAAALERLKQERFYYRSMPADEYLWDFLMRSGLYAHYGTQPGGKLRQANLRMLCQKAGDYALLHREGLAGFLASVNEGRGGDGASPTVVNPWEDVVRIMTVHKSKGLEFPTVYVMGLGTGLSRRRATKTITFHGELGLGLMCLNEKARTKRVTLLQGAILLRLSAEERAEKARLLYVAMTRPKNRLVMIGSAPSKKNALESTVENALLKANEINDLVGVKGAGTYLEWLCQCVQPQDLWQSEDEWQNPDDASNFTCERHYFNKLPTSFPHKNGVWRVVFHSDLDNSRVSQSAPDVNPESDKILQDLLTFGKDEALKTEDGKDPLSPLPDYPHPPLKLGVTAICRALAQREAALAFGDGDEEETVGSKRLPLLTERPRLLSAVADEPAFMKPSAENKAILKGVATHRLLGLLPLAGVRQAIKGGELEHYIKEEIALMAQEGMMAEAEAKAADLAMAAAFFRSDLGRRVLSAQEVHREWSFNLRISEPIATVVQGVIDLCFLENDQWVLVDFKTDKTESAAALWPRYERQLGFYRQALEEATPWPVKEMGLYALRLNQVAMKS